MVSLRADRIDMSDFIKLDIDHRISRHWSAGGCAWIMPGGIKGGGSEEEAHDNEFSEEEMTDNQAGIPYFSLQVRFWPDSPYRGTFISVGSRLDMKGKVGCLIGFGYVMKIYGKLSLMVSCEKCFGQEDRHTNGIGAGICIDF